MNTIHLKGANPFEDLRTLAQSFSGTLNEGLGFSSLVVENSFGQGHIATYKVSDKLRACKFDIRFNQEVILEIGSANHTLIDFLYCLEGQIEHSFRKNRSFQNIGFRQNTLAKRTKGNTNFLKFPSNELIRMSYLILDLPEENREATINNSILRARTNKLKDVLEVKDGYLYNGRVCFRTAEYVKVMMEKSVDNIADVFSVEAAILNILASQIGRYQADTSGKHTHAPIRPSEIDKIYSLHAFITDNLTENLQVDKLVILSGLSAAKLQLGFKYLYNNNVASYITQRRVELAAQLMENGDMNISEVVYAIGFSSRSYFSKIFKRRFGIRPSDYVRTKTKPIVA